MKGLVSISSQAGVWFPLLLDLAPDVPVLGSAQHQAQGFTGGWEARDSVACGTKAGHCWLCGARGFGHPNLGRKSENVLRPQKGQRMT